MIKSSGQCSVASGQKFKRCIVFLLILAVHCALFTVVIGCGKKAPPKPPADSMFIGDIKIVMEILNAFF